ncbi:MAG: hypothetical protein FWH53_01260 [Leptospirales bacterium]|nr:hypothetical protein [Leptospirales bacterium]
MADDRKVKDDLTTLRSKFLPNEIVNVDGGKDIYALEHEFAKTKKNINWLVIILVLLFVSIIVVFTLFFKYYADKKDEDIDVDIAEFDDVRLRDILHSSRMAENNIQIKSNELESLIIRMKNQMLEVNNAHLAKVNAVLDQGLPFPATHAKLTELKNAEQIELNKIRVQYESNINAKRQEINKLQREKRDEEKRLAAIKKEGGGNVADEDKVYQMKMKSLYEASTSGLASMADFYNRYNKYLIEKYNPVFSSDDLKSTIDKNSKTTEKRNLKEYDDIFSKERIISKKQFDDIRVKISDQDKIIQRLGGIGYENSVPPALRSIDNLSASIINDYENLWFSLTSNIKNKNSQIEYYKVALDASLKERPESGYIISAEDPGRILIHINRLIKVKEGDTGFVFRTDDKYIGKVEFYSTLEGLKGRVIDLVDSEKIRPFDRILIKIKQE